jgi:hypothetical protein
MRTAWYLHPKEICGLEPVVAGRKPPAQQLLMRPSGDRHQAPAVPPGVAAVGCSWPQQHIVRLDVPVDQRARLQAVHGLQPPGHLHGSDACG